MKYLNNFLMPSTLASVIQTCVITTGFSSEYWELVLEPVWPLVAPHLPNRSDETAIWINQRRESPPLLPRWGNAHCTSCSCKMKLHWLWSATTCKPWWQWNHQEGMFNPCPALTFSQSPGHTAGMVVQALADNGEKSGEQFLTTSRHQLDTRRYKKNNVLLWIVI